MAKYKLSKKVISVSIRGSVYHKLDSKGKVVVFDDENGFTPSELESAYRSGFLMKIEGKKEILWDDEKKSVEKADQEKSKVKKQKVALINKTSKEIKALEAKMKDVTEEERLVIEKEIAEKGKEIDLLKEELN